MDTLIALAFGSLKALILMVAAAGLAAALRRRPARFRVVVWSTALAGSLVIPVVTPILPPLQIPLPMDFGIVERTAAVDPVPRQTPFPISAVERWSGASNARLPSADQVSLNRTVIPPRWLAVGWALGAVVLFSHLAVGLWRMERTVRGAPTVGNSDWQVDLAWACERVGCRRSVRLAWSPAVDIPATVGVLRPTVLLPSVAIDWDRERREAVLLHEIIHISRFDWPIRIVARLARVAYWFNPLAWWAVRRLDLEQELACDEEVVALGTRPSSYACHLLGIARAVGRRPVPAFHGLQIIRKSHLEERIMTILHNKNHRRAGLAALAPAAILIASLVPALAAVAPVDPLPASPSIKQVLAEMKEAETRFEPHFERMNEIELEMAPELEALEQIEIDIDHEAIAAIEERMQPYLERIAEIEIDLEPHNARMAEIERQLQDVELHIEDGNLEDVNRQIHDQIAQIHVDMEPFHDRLEAIHLALEPLHEELAEIQELMKPHHEALERFHSSMEPFHQRMAELHRELEPFNEEMEQLGRRLEEAIGTEVAANLRRHLGAVTGPDSPFTEAAARIVDTARIRSDEDSLRINVPPDETRNILIEMFGPHRIGVQQSFNDAIDAATTSMSPMVISLE